VITQEQIKEYLDAQDKIKRAEARLSMAKAQFKDGEQKLLSRVLNGEEVEKGKFRIWTEKAFKRASISWKSIVQELKGLAYVEKLMQKAKRDEYDILKAVEDVE
jgi:hypothetical protein